jgi:hypothetical protein
MKIHNKLNPEIHNKLLILGFIRVNPKRCNFSVFQKNTEINVYYWTSSAQVKITCRYYAEANGPPTWLL